jgi:hypothetical protein
MKLEVTNKTKEPHNTGFTIFSYLEDGLGELVVVTLVGVPKGVSKGVTT